MIFDEIKQRTITEDDTVSWGKPEGMISLMGEKSMQLMMWRGGSEGRRVLPQLFGYRFNREVRDGRTKKQKGKQMEAASNTHRTGRG